MNNNIKKLLKLNGILFCIVISYIFCGRFFALPNKRSNNIGKVKQDIVENLATILSQSSKVIELIAKSQTACYEAIAQLASNDKESKLVKSNKKDLEKTLVRLQEIKDDNDKYIDKMMSFLRLAHGNFIDQTEKKGIKNG